MRASLGPRSLAMAALGVAWLVSGSAASAGPATPHPGFFPVTQVNQGIQRNAKTLVVDLDNNGGQQEIVVGTHFGRIFVFNHDGSIRTGWGGAGVFMPSEIAATPAAGNLDGDQELEIVVACGHANPGEEVGQVAAFNPNGSVLWRFNGIIDVAPPAGPEAVFSSPALGDLDGDGRDDVTFAAFDQRVWAIKGTNGTVLPGWPVWIRESIWSSPAMADLDGNGTLEVIIGSDVQAEPTPFDTPVGGALWVFRGNGSQFPGFPRFVTYPSNVTPVGIQASPVVGDITGDGCPEIIVGTGLPAPPYTNTAGRTLHAWSWDGTIPPGWPKALDGHVAGSAALANLDADAALEVVVGATDLVNHVGWVYALNGNGSEIFKVRPRASNGSLADTISEVAIAQMNTQNPAIFVGSVGTDVAILSKTGVQISDDFVAPHNPSELSYGTGQAVAGPAVANLDGNGKLTLVAASAASSVDPDDLGVFAWDVADPVGAMPWPMSRQNSRHHATAPGTTGCPVPRPPLDFFTITPCRISDSRQAGNLTYGGPKLVGGEERTIGVHDNQFHTACGIPPTARAVAINVTVEAPTAPGFLQVFPGHDGVPATSWMNFRAGQTRANNGVVALSFDGRGHLTIRVGLSPSDQVHVIVDAVGFFQ